MMDSKKEFGKLDALMDHWFTQADETGATLGFESRIMARVAQIRDRQEMSLWDVLSLCAKPWLVTGLAAAALLAVVVFQEHGSNATSYLTTALDGPLVAHWMTL